MTSGKYLNGKYEQQKEIANNLDRFQGFPAGPPDQEETFKHMFEILDTNHLTHELNAHDWEVIELLSPDIGMADVSDESSKYFTNISVKKWARIKARQR